MMNLVAKSLALSSVTLLSSELPYKEKVKILTKYFDPTPGTMIRIDPREERERTKLSSTHLMKGYILVLPPKGVCFTIRVREKTKDFTVCEKKKLPFQLRDLNPDGSITWNVRTGPQDFGTELTWQSKYRIVNQVTHDMPWPGPSVDSIVKSCIAKRMSGGDRSIEISFFHGGKWVIRLPKKDIPVNRIDLTPPNLYIQKRDEDKSFEKIGQAKQKTAEELEMEGKEIKKKQKKPASITSNWQTHPRGSYKIPNHRLVFDSSPAGKSQGACRYKYSGYRYDKKIGSLECHDVGPFKWLYLPLECMSELQVRHKK